MCAFSLNIKSGITYGSVNRIGSLVEKYADNALIISENILSNFGLPGLIKDSLKKKEIKSILFDEVAPNPGSRVAEKVIDFAKISHIKAVIGIGGVGLLSIAKIVSKLVPNTIGLDDYLSYTHFKKKLPESLPYIEIPASFRNPFAFTGFSLIIDSASRSPRLINFESPPDEILFDPDITATLSDKYSSSILFDILLHAVEGYFSSKATFLSDTYFLQAIKLVISSIIMKLTTPANESIRRYASQAGFLTSLGLYAMEPEMGGRITFSINGLFKLSKSWISTVISPHILGFNANCFPDKIKILDELISNNPYFTNDRDSDIVEKIRNFIVSLQLPMRLSDFGIKIEDISRIIEGVNSLDTKKIPPDILSEILNNAL